MSEDIRSEVSKAADAVRQQAIAMTEERIEALDRITKLKATINQRAQEDVKNHAETVRRIREWDRFQAVRAGAKMEAKANHACGLEPGWDVVN